MFFFFPRSGERKQNLKHQTFSFQSYACTLCSNPTCWPNFSVPPPLFSISLSLSLKSCSVIVESLSLVLMCVCVCAMRVWTRVLMCDKQVLQKNVRLSEGCNANKYSSHKRPDMLSASLAEKWDFQKAVKPTSTAVTSVLTRYQQVLQKNISPSEEVVMKTNTSMRSVLLHDKWLPLENVESFRRRLFCRQIHPS